MKVGHPVERRKIKMSSRKADHSQMPAQKSVILAYGCWLFGGFFGLHHMYLHRDRHAFVFCCTLGGYFGLAWLYDLFKIPEYVRDCNEDPAFVDKYKETLRRYKKPEYSSKRFLAAIMVAFLFGQVFLLAIPEDVFGGIDWTFLHWGTPLFIALGIWIVGNIGRERGVLWHSLLASYAIYPIRYVLYDETYTLLITAIASGLIFDTFSKQWLLEPPRRRGKIERGVKFMTAVTIYLSFWSCFLYFNGTIKDEEGGEIPVHEAVTNFLASPWWTDLKQALHDTWQYGQHHGWYETWKEILDSMDVDGERNSYKVLGVSATASQSEITSAYRKLSKEFHPDKAKNDEDRAVHSQKFMEVQQAYDNLSKLKSNRRRRNKKFNDDL